MRRSLIAFALLAALASVGCAPKSVVGTWQVEGLADNMPGKTKATLNADKSFTATMQADAKDIPALQMLRASGTAAATATGTYTYDGKALTWTVNEVKVDATNMPPIVKDMVEGDAGKRLVEGIIGKTRTIEVEWQEDGGFRDKANPKLKFSKS